MIRTRFLRLLNFVSVASLNLFFEGIVQVIGDWWSCLVTRVFKLNAKHEKREVELVNFTEFVYLF